jgi:hypothetical protein
MKKHILAWSLVVATLITTVVYWAYLRTDRDDFMMKPPLEVGKAGKIVFVVERITGPTNV